MVAFFQRDFEKYRDSILENLNVFRQRGYSMFQSKAAYGPDYAIRYIEFMKEHLQPHESLWFDCNRGWTVDDALRVCKQAAGLSFYLEQPCETYEECRDVMRYSGAPVILDECMIKMKDLARAAVEGGIGGINLKIGRVGGPTKAKQMRDFCISMRIPVYPMTTNSTEIGDAVLAHLSHSTPVDILRTTCVAHALSASSTADGLSYIDGKLSASNGPGLGLKVKEENLTFLQSWE
jgi:L-alanine-DL-glutamate epimerase-like enolase superfamily enzyme